MFYVDTLELVGMCLPSCLGLGGTSLVGLGHLRGVDVTQGPDSTAYRARDKAASPRGRQQCMLGTNRKYC